MEEGEARLEAVDRQQGARQSKAVERQDTGVGADRTQNHSVAYGSYLRGSLAPTRWPGTLEQTGAPR